MSPSPMAKADFLTSLVFFVLGLYMIVEGLGMPGAGGFIEEGGEPGRVPVLLGGIVAFFAIVLLVRSVFRHGHRLLEKGSEDNVDYSGYVRSAVAALGCSLYAVGLLNIMIAGWDLPYELATAVFLFLFIVGFEWQDARELGAARWEWLQRRWPSAAGALASGLAPLGRDRGPYVWLIVTALLQTVIVTWAVSYLFEKQFYVLLP